eukprot:1415965-Prymnesium_polylepis.1
MGGAAGGKPVYILSHFPVLRLIKKSAFVARPKLLDYVYDRAELLMRSEEARRPRDSSRPSYLS